MSVEAARAALQKGNPVEAERQLRRALKANDGDAPALHLLGLIQLRKGDLEGAADLLARATAADPTLPEAAIGATEALRQAKRFDEAVAAGRRAVELAPDVAPAWNNLGLALDEAGEKEEAEAAFRRSIEVDPKHPKAHLNLGNLLRLDKRFAEAEASFRAALAIRPDYPQALNSLGVVLGDLGRPEEASQAFHAALRLQPRYTKPLTNLGKLFLDLEKPADALRCFEEAARRAPKPVADPLILQAQALHKLKRGPEAIERLKKASQVEPDSALPHFEAGSIQFARFAFDHALAAFRRAVDRDPEHVAARANLVFSKAQVCDWSDWESELERLRDDVRRELDAGRPSPLPAHSSIFFPFTAAEQLEIARRQSEGIAERAAKFALPPAEPRERAPGDRLRIGYLSMDYRDNALAHLARRLFESHDRERVEAIALSFGPDDKSDWRRAIVASAERFVELRDLPSPEAARRIREFELDVLVDLAGYAGNAKPEIVALRPAPLQALWLYPGGGGGVFHDLLIGDAVITPQAEADAFGETILRLPASFQITDGDPPVATRVPTRGDCGLPDEGFVFCAFNQFAKIDPSIFTVWMRLLDRVPGSVLWLQGLIPAGRENLKRNAETAGIDPSRLVFAPLTKKPEHLARHAHADLFLDTRYCNAHTTASDALAMGVPLVTCPWPTYAGRVAASLATAMGFPEMIVDDLEGYEALAFDLATDRERLDDLSGRLRAARATAPLFDTRATVAALEQQLATATGA